MKGSHRAPQSLCLCNDHYTTQHMLFLARRVWGVCVKQAHHHRIFSRILNEKVAAISNSGARAEQPIRRRGYRAIQKPRYFVLSRLRFLRQNFFETLAIYLHHQTRHLHTDTDRQAGTHTHAGFGITAPPVLVACCASLQQESRAARVHQPGRKTPCAGADRGERDKKRAGARRAKSAARKQTGGLHHQKQLK